MCDFDDFDNQHVVFYLADNPEVAYAVAPESCQIGSQGIASQSRVRKFDDLFEVVNYPPSPGVVDLGEFLECRWGKRNSPGQGFASLRQMEWWARLRQ
jgi:hypothetical protein